MKNPKYLHEVIDFNAWKDQTCILIGGGPSIENFPVDKLNGKLTIGINKAFKKFSPTINYSMDMKFYEMLIAKNADKELITLQNEWNKYNGVKVFLDLCPKYPFTNNVLAVKKVISEEVCSDLSKGIFPGDNSGFGALMIACGLGCKRILLLGYDFYITGNKTHWHEGYKHQEAGRLARKLLRYREIFDKMAPIIKAKGIEVVNLNPKSLLECFPKFDMKDVIW